MPNQKYFQKRNEIIFKSTLVTVIFIFPFLTLVYFFFTLNAHTIWIHPKNTRHFFSPLLKLDKYNLLTRTPNTEHQIFNLFCMYNVHHIDILLLLLQVHNLLFLYTRKNFFLYPCIPFSLSSSYIHNIFFFIYLFIHSLFSCIFLNYWSIKRIWWE